MKLTVFATLLLMMTSAVMTQAWNDGNDRAVDIRQRRSLQNLEVGKSRFCDFSAQCVRVILRVTKNVKSFDVFYVVV